jgi:prepilin-type N-terminal cleavage/methylation domain-containing protein
MIINNKNGFTLLELMIGILVSSIVFFGAITFVQTTVQTDEYQKEMIILQNESKFSIDYLVNDIQLAGFVLSTNSNAYQKQPFIWDDTLDSYDSRISDSIHIEYDNFNNNTNCSGVSNLTTIRNFYFVNDQDQLLCNDIVLMENVKSLQFLYGVDINGDFRADRYLKSGDASIASLDSRFRIVSVRLDIVTSSETGYGGVYEKSFDIIAEPTITYDDNLIYRHYSRSLILKNMG